MCIILSLKEGEGMKDLKKILIRYSGRIVEAFLLGTYMREYYRSQKTLLEKLLKKQTRSKILTTVKKTYLVFIPWKHQAKQLLEITESDILPFDEVFPTEWVSMHQYTSIGTEEYHPSMTISDFSGYSFIFQNNSFISDQICGENETNLNILYTEMPELLNEKFDEEIF